MRKLSKNFLENDRIKLTLGSIYAENSDFVKAENIYRLLEEKYGNGGNVTILAVRNLMNEKKLDEAKDKVMNILRDNPDNTMFNGILAEIYRKKGDRYNAEAVYQKIINIDSTNIQIVLSLVDFLLEGKEYNDFFKFINDLVIDNQFSRDDMMGIFSKVLEDNDLIKDKGIELEIVIRVLESTFENDNIIMMLRPELYQKEGKPELAATKA